MTEIMDFRIRRGFRCKGHGGKLWVGQSSDLVGLPDDAEAPHPFIRCLRYSSKGTLH